MCIDLVNSTKFIEKHGDVRASQAMRIYDRIFRGLLIKYNGLEIDKTDGALLIFETMREALAYVTEYHALIEHHLNMYSRVGIHCGHIIMHSNNACFVARGAKPVEVDGIHKVITARVMSVAAGGQTLLSHRAGEYAASVRGTLYMRDIGIWKLKGVRVPLQLYAVSANTARLVRPASNDKVMLLKAPPLTTKERWLRRFKRYVLPPLILFFLYLLTGILLFMQMFNVIPYIYADKAHAVMQWICQPAFRDFWRNLF